MIKINIADPVFKNPLLPEVIFDKVEALELKRALNPFESPFVELTNNEYFQIADKVMSAAIGIVVSDYYGVSNYQSVMPEQIFDALELASLNGESTAMVSKAQFDEMIAIVRAFAVQ